ncbi:MAG: diacylglycerol kinase family protein, partial [Pseudomonadales bacterium]
MKVLVVSNVTASRASRHLEALRGLLPETEHVRHHVTRSGPELDPLLGHDRWAPDDLLVINGGDGSVQHALTLLLARCPIERLPRVACLPGGTTNMTAYDVNDHRRFRDCLTALGAAVNESAGNGGPVVPRPLVRVAPEDGAGAAVCGLFFGMGTIVQGIEYFHARIRHGGGAHELGAGVALARTIWGMARGEPPFAEPARVRVDDEDWSVRLLLVTTLDRLLLGLRPYWGQGGGALKATAVEARAAG